MRYKAYVATYADESREVNKDNYFLNGICREEAEELICFEENKNFRSRNLYAITSGAKSAVKGEVASYLAVDALKGFLGTDFADEHRDYFDFANSAVRSLAFETKEKDFDVDISVLSIKNDIATVYNVGGASVFCFKKGVLKKLTGEAPKTVWDAKRVLDKDGEWQTVEVERSVIPYIGCMGEGEAVPHICEPIRLRGNEIFLMCTKSVTDVLKKNVLIDVLNDKKIKCQDKPGRIIELASQKQPDGNFTVQVVEAKKGLSLGKDETHSLANWLVVALACFAFGMTFPFVAEGVSSIIDDIKTYISEKFPKEEKSVDLPVWTPKTDEEKTDNEKSEESGNSEEKKETVSQNNRTSAKSTSLNTNDGIPESELEEDVSAEEDLPAENIQSESLPAEDESVLSEPKESSPDENVAEESMTTESDNQETEVQEDMSPVVENPADFD